MKVTGFTIVRNALKYDYPVVEAITSVLPVCDEFIVGVGNSEDATLGLIRSIASPRIRIVESVWDDSLRTGGKVLAVETNKVFDAIDASSDWALYIQADEAVHEKDHTALRSAMEKWKDNREVEGLLFNYRHFYGDYGYVADSRRWYRNEVRIIRNDKNIRSFRDAQGFQKNGHPLRVKPADAEIYHYGWVKPPQKQQAKQESFHKMWHDDKWVEQNIPQNEAFDYLRHIDSLKSFEGTHPQVMQQRIARKDWTFRYDPSKIGRPWSLKEKLLMGIEKMTGWRIGEYRNYKIV